MDTLSDSNNENDAKRSRRKRHWGYKSSTYLIIKKTIDFVGNSTILNIPPRGILNGVVGFIITASY